MPPGILIFVLESEVRERQDRVLELLSAERSALELAIRADVHLVVLLRVDASAWPGGNHREEQ